MTPVISLWPYIRWCWNWPGMHCKSTA